MANMLLLSRGTGGDIFPFIQLGKVMRDRGHAVTVMTNCLFAVIVQEAKLDFLALDSVDDTEPSPQEFARFQNTAYPSDKLYRKYLHSALIKECQALNYIMQCQAINDWRRSNDTVLVAHHSSHLLAQVIAERFNIPYVMVFLTPYSLAILSAYEEFYKSQADGINQLRSMVDLSPVSDWHQWLRKADRRLAIWPEWFAPTGPEESTNASRIGFIQCNDLKKDPIPGELQWIRGSVRPPILITHGTSPALLNFFEACVEACRILDYPGIIVTNNENLSSIRLPDQVRWFKYSSNVSVIPHTSAIIHHAGIGTSALALAAGIPQLALAYGFDQPENARRLQALGVAEYLPPFQWQPEIIAGALHRLMTSSVVKERCNHFACHSDNSGSAITACRAIEELLPGQYSASGETAVNET
jgi:rhamnosyltransferase subunit B